MSEPIEDPTVDMFAGMKKKKKSKKVIFDQELEEAANTEAPAEETASAVAEPTPEAAPVENDLDFSDLKKKKKKKTIKLDDFEDAAAPSDAPKFDSLGNLVESTPSETKADVDAGDEFADLKKKKKSKKTAFDLDAFEKELQDAEGESAINPAVNEEPEGDDPFNKEGEESTLSKAEKAAEAKAWLNEDRDYHYVELLGRFYSQLYISHPSLSANGTKKKYTLAPPQMYREGNKRSVFANVVDICKKMHRQPEHVIQFLFAELGTTGSVDGKSQLIIKGRFQQKQIENVLRRYIMEYVTCRTCKSPDTLLTKDNRLFFMTCESCGSTRSVSAIKSGFAAQIGKRKAQKA